MPSDGSALSSHRNKHGGCRPGAGRKPTWPSGATIKTMRLPAVLEEELRRYARQRLAEIKRDQTGTRKADEPPPEFKQVHMQKITTRHFIIVHQKQSIGDVCRVTDDRWLACLYDVDADHHAIAERQTREDAVATLLSQERSRWLNVRVHRVNSFKINSLIFDILP